MKTPIINWNDHKIQNKVKKEHRELEARLGRASKNIFEHSRQKYNYVWLCRDLRIVDIPDMDDGHIKNALKVMFFDLRYGVINISIGHNTKTPLSITDAHKWWYKENQLYTWSKVRKTYPVAASMITELKARDIWKELVAEMEITWPAKELHYLAQSNLAFKTNPIRYAKIIKSKPNDFQTNL